MMHPLAAVWSQARNAWLLRGLLAPRQLLGALPLPYHWYVRRDGSAPTPLFIGWYITYACPQNCAFCNVSKAVKVWHKPMGEKEENLFIDRFVPRIGTVAIGGGEPLFHPGIDDRVSRIRARGGRVLIVTSGTTLGPAEARRLAAAAPEMIIFSVLGDEQTHDREMGRAGSWQKATGGLANFLAARDPRKTRVGINCALGSGNALTMRAVVDLGRKLGVDAVRFTWMSFLTESERRREPHEITYLVLPDEDLGAFDPTPMLATARALEREHPGFVQFTPRLNEGERGNWFRAGGGVNRRCLYIWHTLFVRPDGSVVPCGHLFDDPLGNVRSDRLEAIWNSDRFRSVRRAQWAQPFEVCRRCCKV